MPADRRGGVGGTRSSNSAVVRGVLCSRTGELERSGDRCEAGKLGTEGRRRKSRLGKGSTYLVSRHSLVRDRCLSFRFSPAFLGGGRRRREPRQMMVSEAKTAPLPFTSSSTLSLFPSLFSPFCRLRPPLFFPTCLLPRDSPRIESSVKRMQGWQVWKEEWSRALLPRDSFRAQISSRPFLLSSCKAITPLPLSCSDHTIHFV